MKRVVVAAVLEFLLDPSAHLAAKVRGYREVVPAQEEGFKAVFLGEHRWNAIRISFDKREQIRYVAAYQTKPVVAVTHYAPVATIEPYGEEGKYQLIFSGTPVEIGPIPFADAPSGLMQGPRYTTLAKLLHAKKLTDLFGSGQAV